jgi:hypothetical protein
MFFECTNSCVREYHFLIDKDKFFIAISLYLARQTKGHSHKLNTNIYRDVASQTDENHYT